MSASRPTICWEPAERGAPTLSVRVPASLTGGDAPGEARGEGQGVAPGGAREPQGQARGVVPVLRPLRPLEKRVGRAGSRYLAGLLRSANRLSDELLDLVSDHRPKPHTAPVCGDGAR